ncbi:class I SAM-dependent methyltransferase [Candidatus Woesearchaeota archaeon]|nr:class I SAM-dependent methyltransferase [Candidatus Woesearchaeota archaeon]MBW3005672.1 class I SAM-dependent methyltransferase [Candidatus Woesearchaeota archaeon]
MAKDFGEYWDDLADVKSARKRAKRILGLIKKYKPKAKSVLELGVGSGNVLKCFPKKYALVGLDIDKKYVRLARKKMEYADFIVSSMHNFKINKKFDVIFSVYDSINFLQTFGQWKQTFKTVHKHLNESGLFIFDMYTPKMLERAKNWSFFSKEKFGYMWDKAEVNGNKLTWHFHIFEKEKGNKYALSEHKFHEWMFPVKKVEQELKKYFKIIKKFENVDFCKFTINERILYVVKKK